MKTYKLWLSIEEITERKNGECTYFEYEGTECGEYETIEEAQEAVENLLFHSEKSLST